MEKAKKRYQRDVDERSKDRIRLVLSSGDKDWRALKEGTGLSDSVLSKHLKQLEDKEEISVGIDKKDKRKKIYSINEPGLQKIKKELVALKVYTELDAVFINLMERFDCGELSWEETRDIWFKRMGYLVVNAMNKDKDFLTAFLKGLYILGIKHMDLGTEIIDTASSGTGFEDPDFIPEIADKDLSELKNGVHMGIFKANKIIDKMISTGDYQDIFGDKPPSRLVGYMKKDTLDSIIEEDPALYYLKTVDETVSENEYDMYKEGFKTLMENKMLKGVSKDLEGMENIF